MYREPHPVKEGYIYVAEATSHPNQFKIGRSLRLEERFSQLSCSSPCRLSLKYSLQCKDYIEVEKTLHKLFNRSRLHGEWFDLNAAELYLLETHAKELQTLNSWKQFLDWQHEHRLLF